MAKANTVKQALRWMMLARGAAQTVNWLATIVVIRLLTPTDYGLLAMAMTVIALGQIFRDMGLHSALVQTEDPSTLAIRQVYTSVLALNCLLFVAVWAVAPLVAAHFGEPILRNIIFVLALQFPLQALQSVPSAMYARDMNFKTLALIGAASGITNSIVTLSCALSGMGVWSLVYGNVTATALGMVLLGLNARIFYLPTLNFSGFRRMLSFGGYITLSGLLNYVQNKSPHWLLGTYLGKDDLGIYSVANRLSSLPMQKVAGILKSVGFAAFSKIQDDMDKVRANYLQMQAILAFVAFPVFWGISAVAEALIQVVLGEKWLSIVLPLQLVALAVPLRMLFNVTSPALNGIGNSRLVFTNLMISSLTLTLAYYVALDWGVVGVAAVWITFYPLIFLLQLYRTTSALGINYSDYLRVLYRPLLIAAVMYLLVRAVYWLAGQYSLTSLTTLVLQVAAGAGFYFAASLLLNRDVFIRSRKFLI